MEHRQVSSIARITTGVMLLLALGNWEYSYYQILRVVVCASSIYLAWYLFDNRQNGWAWGFVVTGILFNPIYPIYLDKSTWQLIDIVASVLFFASFSAETKNNEHLSR